MVLQLQVEAVGTEQLAVVQGPRPGLSGLPVQDRGGNVTGKTGAQRDEPLVVPFQELVVDAGLVIEAFRVPEGAELKEVLVAGHVAGKEHQVMWRVPFSVPDFSFRDPGAL